jgi:hypothetical protein
MNYQKVTKCIAGIFLLMMARVAGLLAGSGMRPWN